MWARAAKLLISTSLLLSLDGVLIVIFGSFLYEIRINPALTIASFLVVFSVYNLNKGTDKVEDSVNRPEIASKSTSYYVGSSIVAMLLGLTIGALNGIFALLILSTPMIIGLFYSVKISQKIPRLKDITGAKSVLVAISWSMIGAFLPLSSQPINFVKLTLIFAYIFIQVIVNTILFDSLDTKGDSVIGITTLPMLLGRNRTKRLLVLANSTLIFWLFFCFFEDLFMKFIPALFFGVIYGYVIIWRFLGKDSRGLGTEIIIDGEWLLIVPLMRLVLK